LPGCPQRARREYVPNWRIGASAGFGTGPANACKIFGRDLISYQNDGKGCTTIVGKVERV
jgi:hypothetical protein